MDCVSKRKVGVSKLLLHGTWNMMLVGPSKGKPSHLGPYGEIRRPLVQPESSVGKTEDRAVEVAGPGEDIYKITEVL